MAAGEPRALRLMGRRRPERRRVRSLTTAIELAPGLLVLVGLFALPLVTLLVISFFTYEPGRLFSEVFTLDNYRTAFTDSFYLRALRNTLIMCACVVGACLLVAYPLALYLVNCGRIARTIVVAALIAPLFTSVVVRSYGWTLLLSGDGPVADVVRALGGPDLHLEHTMVAAVIGMVHIELAFMVLPILAALQRVPAHVVEASRSLGAGPVRSVLTVLLPLTAPGIAAGCALVFGMTASAFIEPSILGGPRLFLLATVVYDEVNAKLDWPQAAALGYELLLVTLVVATVSIRMGRPKWQDQR